METFKKLIFIFKDLMVANGLPGLLVLLSIFTLFLLGYNSFGSFMLGLLVSNNNSFIKPLLRKFRNSKSKRIK